MIAQNTQKESNQPRVEESTESKLTVVKFHQTKISCSIDPSGQVWIGINPICEAIGIDVKRALLTIKQDSILGAKVSEQTLLDAKNRKFPMQCIPIQYIHGWLFLIQENKVNAKAQPKLRAFKEECYQVLFDHFYGKYRVYEENLRERRHIEEKLTNCIKAKHELNLEISAYKKQLSEINTRELTGQLSINLKGGK